MATPHGIVHDITTDTLVGLSTLADLQYKATRDLDQRVWWNTKAGPNIDPLNIPGVVLKFDRQKVNTNFGELIADGANPGALGDVISVKTQCDYVAIAERAYRARHCTPVRSIALAAARRRGHGDPLGVFQGGVLRYVQDMLKAAAAT